MIGRKAEQDELMRMYESNESEFVAIYGRRRVGKTYLVRETFDGQFTFQHSGLAKGAVWAWNAEELGRGVCHASRGYCRE